MWYLISNHASYFRRNHGIASPRAKHARYSRKPTVLHNPYPSPCLRWWGFNLAVTLTGSLTTNLGQHVLPNMARQNPSPHARFIARSVCEPGKVAGEERGLHQVSGAPVLGGDSAKVPICLLWVNQVGGTYFLDLLYGMGTNRLLIKLKIKPGDKVSHELRVLKFSFDVHTNGTVVASKLSWVSAAATINDSIFVCEWKQ